MQKFICPSCKFESTYDPWHESARCPKCGYTPPPGMQISDAARASHNWHRKQRLLRLKILRNALILALPCTPLLAAMVIFSQIFTATGLERPGSFLALIAVIGIFDIPIIIILSGAILVIEQFIAQEAMAAWQQFARQANLTHNSRTIRFLSRNLTLWDVGQVSGTYQGHQVSVYTKRISPYRLITCMTLERKQMVEGDLTLAYVHYPDPYALIESKLSTFKQAFKIQQQPEHFGDAIIASAPLRARLLRMHQGTTLHIHKTHIELQQAQQSRGLGVYGIEQDAAYLHFLLDLLNDLAEALEAPPTGNEPIPSP